jgi:predicted dehydrogenase
MSDIKVAFVGSGYMAREHAKAFKDLPSVRLAGVYGRTTTSAQKFAEEFSMPVISSLAALFAETKADLVVVAVDELSIMEVMKSVLAHPWAILMEKPPGYRPQDSEELLRISDERKARCFVAMNRRFMSSARNARELLDQTPEQRMITVVDQEDVIQAAETGQPVEVQEHWMYANSIHIIDLLRYFGRGKVTKVVPVLPWKGAQDTAMLVSSVHFDSGDIGLYKGIWNAPGPWMTEIVTKSQRFELRPIETLQKQIRGQRTMEVIPGSAFDKDFKPGLRLMAEHCVRMLQGKKDHNLPTLADAVETMRLIAAIFKS